MPSALGEPDVLQDRDGLGHRLVVDRERDDVGARIDRAGASASAAAPPAPPRPAAGCGARFQLTRLMPLSFVPSMVRIVRPVASAIVIFTSPVAADFK